MDLDSKAWTWPHGPGSPLNGTVTPDSPQESKGATPEALRHSGYARGFQRPAVWESVLAPRLSPVVVSKLLIFLRLGFLFCKLA